MSLKKLPVDLSTFSIMREEDYLYVDKTRQIYNLITRGRLFFLSRPRRFGKSLLISTLKELFSGNRQLFEDLWIDTSDYTWQEHPVLAFDFSGIDYSSPELCKASIDQLLMEMAEDHAIVMPENLILQVKIERLVKQLAKKNKVVILIDEYDNALVNALHDPVRARGNLDALRLFFSGIKRVDQYLRSVFITGVSKFAKASLFSGLNNLRDISMLPIAADLLGYTQEEVDTFLMPHLEAMAGHVSSTETTTREQLRIWYDGYHFCSSGPAMYNPFSVLNCLNEQSFKTFWFGTGTPSFLMRMLSERRSLLPELEGSIISEEALDTTFDIGHTPLLPVLFQTGYVTLVDYDQSTHHYKLDYPNKETRDSFRKYVVAALAYVDVSNVQEIVTQLKIAIAACDVPSFCKKLQALLAHIPYQLHIREEKYYHSLMQLLMSLLGLEAQSEISTDAGRIDMILVSDKVIFIIEIKLDVDAKTALAQIEERKYYQRYQATNKKIMLIGMAFKPNDNVLQLNYEFKDLI